MPSVSPKSQITQVGGTGLAVGGGGLISGILRCSHISAGKLMYMCNSLYCEKKGPSITTHAYKNHANTVPRLFS